MLSRYLGGLHPKRHYNLADTFKITVVVLSMSGLGASSFQIFSWHLAVSPLLFVVTIGEGNQQSHHLEIFWLLWGC